jgi:hypothetical protein
MTVTTIEARQRVLDDLADATDQIALAIACLTEAFEQLAVDAAEQLEDELFRPLQKAYGRAKTTRSGFAARVGMRAPGVQMPDAGRSSQGVKEFIERAETASAEADRIIAELQDSMIPIESGDAELRAGLGDVRELLARVPDPARRLQRELGR